MLIQRCLMSPIAEEQLIHHQLLTSPPSPLLTHLNLLYQRVFQPRAIQPRFHPRTRVTPPHRLDQRSDSSAAQQHRVEWSSPRVMLPNVVRPTLAQFTTVQSRRATARQTPIKDGTSCGSCGRDPHFGKMKTWFKYDHLIIQ
jgi:hypothetical protein